MMKKQVFFGICTAILTAMLIFTGCQTESSDDGEIFARDVDIVVVGAGIAGASAALSAKEADPNIKVVLIDKNNFVGGTLRRALGGISNVTFGAKDDPAGALTSWKNTAEPEGSPDTGYPDYGKWLQVAVHVKDMVDMLYREEIMPTPSTLSFTGGGAGGAGKFEEAVLADHHIEFIGECTAKEIIVIDGVVSGIRAEKSDGTRLNIKAKNVILASGGFSRSNEMLAEYANPTLNPGLKEMAQANYIRSQADTGATGDGLRMALEVGAVLYQNFYVSTNGMQFADEVGNAIGELAPAFRQAGFIGSPQLQVREQVLVNNTGKRFRSEEGAITYGMAMGLGNPFGVSLVTDGKPPYYILYDSNNPNSGANAVDLTAALNAAADLNIKEVFKADTIGALAELAEIPRAALEKTVSDYNGYITNQADTEFSKPASRLTKKLETGPFFAVKLYPCSFLTMAGIVTDGTGRVLDKNGNTIPHLYAAGELSNRDYYNIAYPAGASLSLYPTMGRLAAFAAAKNK
jgi:fumarate reductase flavoprotein subunit